MKGAVFYGKHDVRVETCEEPELGEEDVLIQVKACGICGTDVHIFEGEEGAASVTPPIILGHEFSGIIVKTGKNVSNWKAGDRVCVDPNCYCGKCDACRNGIPHFCESMICYGTTVNGGFAEYCAVNERQIYRMGCHTGFEQAAMAEPVACCLHGIDMCDITPGHYVAIIGGGMIGLLMLQLARLKGAAKTALIELEPAKRKAGARLGADICIDPAEQNITEALHEAGMGHVDTVIECVGKTETMEQAIDIAGNKATVMLFGLTGAKDTIRIKPFQIFQKELTIKASYINPYTHKRALELIDSGRLDVSSIICERIELDGLPEILANPGLRAKGKYIVKMEDEK